MTVSMAQGKVDRWNGTSNLRSSAIQHGIFHGDSISPLLFVICPIRLLRSALNGHKIITAINIWAVTLIWYSADILAWTQDKLKSADRRTRKLMTMHGALDPRADVARKYVSRKEVGRGLQSIHDVVTMEKSNLQRYVFQSDAELIMLAAPILWPHLVAPLDTSQVVKCGFKKNISWRGPRNPCMGSLSAKQNN